MGKGPKRFCPENVLRMGMDALRISSKRAKVEKSDGMIETLFTGIRGMQVEDIDFRRKVVHLGKDELSDTMRDVLSDNSDTTLAVHGRANWKIHLAKLFRAVWNCEEVWIASPQDLGGQVFRISFRRPVSMSSSFVRPTIEARPLKSMTIDDMSVEEYSPGSVRLPSLDTEESIVVEELDDDNDVLIAD